MTWRPLRDRLSGSAAYDEALYDGVPEHLFSSLDAWIDDRIAGLPGYRALQRALREHLRIETSSGSIAADASLHAAYNGDPEIMFDVADYLLKALLQAATHGQVGAPVVRGIAQSNYPYADAMQQLQAMLTEAGSAYAVEYDDDGWRITQRVDDTARQAAAEVMSTKTSAAGHIAAAWRSCFGRDPDYEAAYGEAVLAVEAVACPVLTPNDVTLPTLGKAITHLKDTTANWTVANLDATQQASGATLLAMLRTIWHNHQRHAAQKAAGTPVGQSEAEVAVFLAVTLVQWFERSLVRRI